MGRPGEKGIWGGKCPCCLANNYFVTSNTCHKRSKEGFHVPSVLHCKGIQLWGNDGVKGGKKSLRDSGLREGRRTRSSCQSQYQVQFNAFLGKLVCVHLFLMKPSKEI